MSHKYTREELEAMGEHELVDVVATVVMGWRRQMTLCGFYKLAWADDNKAFVASLHWSPLQRITDTIQVWNRICTLGFEWRIQTSGDCVYVTPARLTIPVLDTESAWNCDIKRAICMAAILAVQELEE